ncbi:MAG TPA: hypothetical protein DCE48_07655 [Lachnospiraceae bacterium]|nr:hypothetical protein [Lachnospiraceae bacterium]
MREGDSESNYAHYCLHKFHILPSEFINLDDNEKAFVIASIRVKIEDEKKEQEKAKRKSKH